MNKKIKIQEQEFSVGRLLLKGWTQVNALREDMEEAISKKDFTRYAYLVVQIIEIASSPIPKINWKIVPWMDVLSILDHVLKSNTPTIKFPILKGNKKERQTPPWEYHGRSWYFWLNLFASNYGWNEFRIANLDIDTAIGLYQEITINEQLQREWEWGMSEVSYPYDPSTKLQKHKPLERPDWMVPMTPEPKKVLIRRELMPEGNVIYLDEAEKKKRGI